MTINRWKLFSMPVAVFALASPMLMNCGAGGLPGGLGKGLPGPLGDVVDAAGGCDEFKTGDFSALKFKGGADLKIKGFLNASFGIKKVMDDMEVDLIGACTDLGTAIGMSADDLKTDPDGGKGADKVCGAVAAKVDAVIKANAGVALTVEVDPPKCFVPIDSTIKCLTDCGSPVKGGELKADCQGGDIAGSCDAECKGSCTVDAGASCTGTCKATCQGACDVGFKGTCGGNCKGKCDGKATSGGKAGAACAGTCEGKCDASAQGSCTGSCAGKCTGACEVHAKGKCEGKCTGGCSVEMKAPSCTGEFKPPSVDPSCQMSCAAKGLADLKCDPPNVRVVAKGKATADFNTMLAGLQIALPRVLRVQLGTAKRLAPMVAGVVKSGVDVKDVALKAGGKAVACIKEGIEATAGAGASVKANVHASASFSGSIGGSAGGSASASGSAKGGT